MTKKNNPGITNSDHLKIWDKLDCLEEKINDVIILVKENKIWIKVLKWFIPIIFVFIAIILGVLLK